MSPYLLFVLGVLLVVAFGFGWLILAALGIVADPTDPEPWTALDEWEAQPESITEALALTEDQPLSERRADNIRPIREAPSFGRIADLLAHNEAARLDPDTADWSESARWTEGPR